MQIVLTGQAHGNWGIQIVTQPGEPQQLPPPLVLGMILLDVGRSVLGSAIKQQMESNSPRPQILVPLNDQLPPLPERMR